MGRMVCLPTNLLLKISTIHVGPMACYRWWLNHPFENILYSQIGSFTIFFGVKLVKHMDVSKNRGENPKMDGLQWNTILKWMIWGYHYFPKHPWSKVAILGMGNLQPSKKGILVNGARKKNPRKLG